MKDLCTTRNHPDYRKNRTHSPQDFWKCHKLSLNQNDQNWQWFSFCGNNKWCFPGMFLLIPRTRIMRREASHGELVHHFVFNTTHVICLSRNTSGGIRGRDKAASGCRLLLTTLLPTLLTTPGMKRLGGPVDELRVTSNPHQAHPR